MKVGWEGTLRGRPGLKRSWAGCDLAGASGSQVPGMCHGKPRGLWGLPVGGSGPPTGWADKWDLVSGCSGHLSSRPGRPGRQQGAGLSGQPSPLCCGPLKGPGPPAWPLQSDLSHSLLTCNGAPVGDLWRQPCHVLVLLSHPHIPATPPCLPSPFSQRPQPTSVQPGVCRQN